MSLLFFLSADVCCGVSALGMVLLAMLGVTATVTGCCASFFGIGRLYPSSCMSSKSRSLRSSSSSVSIMLLKSFSFEILRELKVLPILVPLSEPINLPKDLNPLFKREIMKTNSFANNLPTTFVIVHTKFATLTQLLFCELGSCAVSSALAMSLTHVRLSVSWWGSPLFVVCPMRSLSTLSPNT